MSISEFVLYFYNSKLYNEIKTIEINQFESINKINALQESKFKDLINHAKFNVPYYEGKLDEVYEISDIRKIDFLTKDNIRNNQDKLKSKNIDKSRFIPSATSGSTGDSLYTFSDAKNICRKAVAVRGNGWAGQRYGDKQLLFWGAERDIVEKKGLLKRIKHKYLLKNRILSTYYLSNKDLKNYIEIYNKYKPSIIVSYPTPLYHIANYIDKNNIKIYIPKGIVTSAETLFPFQREKIEEVFKCKIYNRYGCREVGHIAAECEIHRGLHINSERFIIETVDPYGQKCKPGELGEIVVTDLDNHVFPLIRYKIGDLGVLSDRICECGRNLPLLEKVEGRVFDLIVGANGNVVGGTFWTLIKHKIKGWKKFQIIQERRNTLKILVEDNNEIESSFVNHLTDIIKEKLGEGMDVTIQLVKEIPLSKTGKHRWIISKISPYVK